MISFFWKCESHSLCKNDVSSLTPISCTYRWQRWYQSIILSLLLEEVRPGIHLDHGTDSQPNPPHIYQTQQPAYHSISKCYYPWQFAEEEEKKYEQYIGFKDYGGGRDDDGAKVFPYISHCWFHNAVIAFSTFLIACAYHVVFQLVKTMFYVCDCGLPCVYGQTSLQMYK